MIVDALSILSEPDHVTEMSTCEQSLEEAGFALSPTAFTHVLVSIFVGYEYAHAMHADCCEICFLVFLTLHPFSFSSKCDREEVQSENSVLWGVVNGKDEWQSFIELQ